MSTGSAVKCTGAGWTLVFDGPVSGLFTGSFQAISGRAFMRVSTTQPAVTDKGFYVDQAVIPLYIRTNEKVYARPVDGRTCEVIMG